MELISEKLEGWKQESVNPIVLKKDEYKVYQENSKIILEKSGNKMNEEEVNSREDKIGAIKAFTFAVDKNRV